MVKNNCIQQVDLYPLVSVTIPTYNAANTLSQTLDSVLAQTYMNIEVIVVDDGSTDYTQDVLRQYASLVITVHQNNGGLASARNAGCRAANGKYIALMDADDLCMPERIAIQVAYMEQNPDIVMCSSDFIAFSQSGIIADSFIANYYSRIPETPGGVAGIYSQREELYLVGEKIITYTGNVYEQIALGSFIHPPTVLFRRNILEECGLVDEQIVNCCDFEWFVRMSRAGKIGYIDRSLLQYRFSENQMSGSRNGLQMCLDIVQVMEKTFAADPALFKRNSILNRRYLGNAYLDAANALVDNRAFEAISMLFRSVMLGVFRMQSLKIIFKAFIPIDLIKWIRERR